MTESKKKKLIILSHTSRVGKDYLTSLDFRNNGKYDRLPNYVCEEFKIPKKFIGHNTKLNGVEKFNGIINRSNLSEDYTDLSPAFNFVYLLENFNDEQ